MDRRPGVKMPPAFACFYTRSLRPKRGRFEIKPLPECPFFMLRFSGDFGHYPRPAPPTAARPDHRRQCGHRRYRDGKGRQTSSKGRERSANIRCSSSSAVTLSTPFAESQVPVLLGPPKSPVFTALFWAAEIAGFHGLFLGPEISEVNIC